jgi:hypothetical protein
MDTPSAHLGIGLMNVPVSSHARDCDLQPSEQWATPGIVRRQRVLGLPAVDSIGLV